MPEREEALSGQESTPTSRPSGEDCNASAKETTLSEGPSQPISFCNAFQNRSALFLTECTSHKIDIFTGCLVLYAGCLPSLFAESLPEFRMVG